MTLPWQALATLWDTIRHFLSHVFARAVFWKTSLYGQIRFQLLAVKDELIENQNIVFALLGSTVVVLILAKVILWWLGLDGDEPSDSPAGKLRRSAQAVTPEKAAQAVTETAEAAPKASPAPSSSSPRVFPAVAVKQEAFPEQLLLPPSQRRLLHRAGLAARASGAGSEGGEASSSRARGRSRTSHEEAAAESPQVRLREASVRKSRKKPREESEKPLKAKAGRLAVRALSSSRAGSKVSKKKDAVEARVTRTRSGRVSKPTPLFSGIITWEGNRPVIDLTQE
ncbi:hypothetical protein BESB_002660 [Besnoitia besnoiti]|uniref:Transmembrane protein n=1 Tax=Besnoitia besnoiti TaxID=94643 RepID=A0A2A9MIX2_BESBE|nr:hypothetical protein BESB_002660 [Besnoitia besnoiti]PFH37925.1 hypothetical protein BESB_002660 [Besnoitia besnoiti]